MPKKTKARRADGVFTAALRDAIGRWQETGRTLYQLAQLAGVSQPTLSNWLNGRKSEDEKRKAAHLRLDTADKLGRALGLQVRAAEDAAKGDA